MARIGDLTRVNEVSDGDVFPIEQASSGRTRSVAFGTIRDEISADVDAAVSIAVAAAAAAEEAAASSDAQILREDLADGVTALKGADLVAYAAGETVREAIEASKQFDADLSNTSDPALGADLVGYMGRTSYDKLREAASLEDYGGVADYYLSNGSVNPTPTDNYPAWLAFIADRTKNTSSSIAPSVGRLNLGQGGYYFGTPLSIKHVVEIVGQGSGQSGNYTTEMVFAGDGTRGVGECSGITIHRHTTDYTSNELVAATTAGDGSVIRGVVIRAASKVTEAVDELDQRNCGIWLRARATLRDVQCINWGGHGRMVVATTGGSEPKGNANLWRMHDCQSNSCGYHGLYVRGADANAGAAFNDNNVSCSGNGIKDASFLGNTYIAGHVSQCYREEHYATYDAGSGIKWWWCTNGALGASTTPGTNNLVWVERENFTPAGDTKPWSALDTYETAGGYHSDSNNSQNAWIGMYSEGGVTGPVVLSQRDVYLGGLQGASVAQRTAKSLNTITRDGVILNAKIKDGVYGSAGSAEFFYENNGLILFSATGSITNQGRLSYTVKGNQEVLSLSSTGVSDCGVALKNIPTDTGGLTRGDWFVSGKVKLGTSGCAIGSGPVLNGLYYTRGTMLLQTNASLGGTSYLQCTVGGVGGSTAVFEAHTL